MCTVYIIGTEGLWTVCFLHREWKCLTFHAFAFYSFILKTPVNLKVKALLALVHSISIELTDTTTTKNISAITWCVLVTYLNQIAAMFILSPQLNVTHSLLPLFTSCTAARGKQNVKSLIKLNFFFLFKTFIENVTHTQKENTNKNESKSQWYWSNYVMNLLNCLYILIMQLNIFISNTILRMYAAPRT